MPTSSPERETEWVVERKAREALGLTWENLSVQKRAQVIAWIAGYNAGELAAITRCEACEKLLVALASKETK